MKIVYFRLRVIRVLCTCTYTRAHACHKMEPVGSNGSVCTVRPMIASDLSAVSIILRDAWGDRLPETESRFQSVLDEMGAKSHFPSVATLTTRGGARPSNDPSDPSSPREGTEIAGVCVCEIQTKLTGEKHGHIHTMAVHERHRGMGVGTTMVKRCVEFAKARGATCIRVCPWNDSVAKFYEKCGFEEIKWKGTQRVIRFLRDTRNTKI